MSREHFPLSEQEHFQPAGRVRRSAGSMDKAGSWVIGGTYKRRDESGYDTDYVRLLKPGHAEHGTLPTKDVPLEEYHQWQLEGVEVPEGVEASDAGLERFTPREQQVFAPLRADKLKRGYGEAPSREDITEGKKQDALNALGLALTRDASLKQILRKRLTREDSEDDVLNALRSNAELRCTIGRYFTEKIASLSYLPERVERNDPKVMKSPDYAGYVEMTSHEYVALLALSMIDGSFDKNREDRSYANEFGEQVLGQHRFTARELLNSYDT